MKILQINNVYGFGSTGKITQQLHKELLARGFESVVYYGRRFKSQDAGVHRLFGDVYGKLQNGISRITGLMYGGCLLSTQAFIRAIEKEKPDVVHLQCLNGYFVNIYKLIAYLKKSGIPTVLTLHAEFMHTANCGHAYDCEKWKTGCGQCPTLKKATNSLIFDRTAKSWKRMKAAFSGFSKLYVIGVSEWITERARESGMFKDAKCIQCIHNGIDLSNFDYRPHEEDKTVAEKYGIAIEKKIVLHVTSSLQSQFKGGKYFLNLAKQLGDDYQCVIVGTEEKPDIEGLICIPFTRNQKELASLYRMANVFVITSTAENYPTVCLEAQACGTPVVGFDVGGVKETIRAGMGVCVAVGDVPAMQNAVKLWCDMEPGNDETLTTCRILNSKERMSKDYCALYESILNNN